MFSEFSYLENQKEEKISDVVAPTLSEEQHQIIQRVVDRESVFVTGAAGTGKSLLLRAIFERLNLEKKRVQVCALTGRAAVQLGCKARTIHSWSGIGIAKEISQVVVDRAVKRFYFGKKLGNNILNWETTEVLIIDEISMMSRKVLEILSKIAQRIRKNSLPFGGLQIVCFGDFFQLGPTGETPREIGDKRKFEDQSQDDLQKIEADCLSSFEFCFESSVWRQLFPINSHIRLTRVFRQKDDNFVKVLSQIRIGRISEKSNLLLQGRVGVSPFEDGVVVCPRLFPLRADADNFNQRMFSLLPDADIHSFGIQKLYNIEPSRLDIGGEKKDSLSADAKDIEIINLAKNSSCQEVLHLKVNAHVMLCVNLDIEANLCNGSLGIVKGFSGTSRNPVVYFHASNQTRVIMAHVFKSSNHPKLGFSQIPLRLAWAMTIHCSQGATLERAFVDVGRNIFAIGQTYVALSRVTALENLFLVNYDPSKIRVSKKVVLFDATF